MNTTVLRFILAISFLFTLAATPAFAQEKPAKMEPKPASPSKPEITRSEPRGLQRGNTVKIQLTGKSLDQLTELKLHHAGLQGTLLAEPKPTATEAWVEITASRELPRSTQEFSLVNPGGESTRMKLFIDDLPQIVEPAASSSTGQPVLAQLPVSCWGTLNPPGDTDQIEFEASRGQTLVFDLQARGIGSKAVNAMLTLLDADGRVLASNTAFDETGDPLIAHRFERSGLHVIRVSDAQMGASPDHYYRLSIGDFPYVTALFPMGVSLGQETRLELTGHNLPRQASASIAPEKAGEGPVTLDPDTYRSRRSFKVLVTEGPEQVESEPNDTPKDANLLSVPAAVNGRIWLTGRKQTTDADLFRFAARSGQAFALQTTAARRDSPLDTRIEVLHADGQPVERVLFQAVRDSAVTFRPIDSVTVDVRVDNWEEMDLNQFLYMQGEVCKITRMPRGPDSGLNFSGNRGKRRAWFDTTPTAHANEEPVYVVEPHPPGSQLVPNGLPVFTHYYANDDDGERELGRDSRLLFTAPTNGNYLVRVTDSRGFGGDLFTYRLELREARPDFEVSLLGTDAKVSPGNGSGLPIRADRKDGFTGPIRVEFKGVPAGYLIPSPIIIEEHQLEADGTLFAQLDAKPITAEQLQTLTVTATAEPVGKPVSKMIKGFTKITLDKAPKFYVKFEPDGAPTIPVHSLRSQTAPPEIVIAPGQTISAWLRLERNGETNLVSLDVENLPHGIIVDNIGLNGVQVRAGEDEREIFLTARPWVQEQDRLCHAVVGSARSGDATAGKQTSFPVLLKVRRNPPGTTASTR